MKIIGLYECCGWSSDDQWLHAAGASLWVDGAHISTISEERLTREKYDGNFPDLSIDYVLDEAEITRDEVELVVYVENVHSPQRRNAVETVLSREFPNSKISFCDHHQAHACATFYTSPFEKASILTFDGAGNSFPIFWHRPNGDESELGGYETGLYAVGDKKNGIYVIYHSIITPNFHSQLRGGSTRECFTFNLGQMYNEISRWCYRKMEPKRAAEISNPYIWMETAPGKIMGLSAYGDKDKVDLPDLFRINDDKFYFPYIYDHRKPTEDQMEKYDPKDIAAWLQHQFETILVKFFSTITIKAPNLCLGGGCGLNVLANAAIIKAELFKDIHIFPAANDSGLCFGGAIYEVSQREKKMTMPKYLGFLGKSYSDEEIEDALQ